MAWQERYSHNFIIQRHLYINFFITPFYDTLYACAYSVYSTVTYGTYQEATKPSNPLLWAFTVSLFTGLYKSYKVAENEKIYS